MNYIHVVTINSCFDRFIIWKTWIMLRILIRRIYYDKHIWSDIFSIIVTLCEQTRKLLKSENRDVGELLSKIRWTHDTVSTDWWEIYNRFLSNSLPKKSEFIWKFESSTTVTRLSKDVPKLPVTSYWYGDAAAIKERTRKSHWRLINIMHAYKIGLRGKEV